MNLNFHIQPKRIYLKVKREKMNRERLFETEEEVRLREMMYGNKSCNNDVKANLYTLNYNILKVMEGMSGLSYSD